MLLEQDSTLSVNILSQFFCMTIVCKYQGRGRKKDISNSPLIIKNSRMLEFALLSVRKVVRPDRERLETL